MSECHLLKQTKPPDIIMYQPQQSENMQEKNQFIQKNYHPDNIDIGLNNIQIPNLINQMKSSQFLMQESHHINKDTILKDKSNILNTLDLMHPFSLILDLVSTTTEKTLKPFFNTSYKEISKKLWLPIKTDCQESDSLFLNGYLACSDPNLHHWTQTDSQKQQEIKCSMKSWKLSPSLLPDTMDFENIQEEKIDDKFVLRSKKIPFKTTHFLRKYINDNFEAFKYFYNNAIDEINKRYNNKKKEFESQITCINDNCKNNKEENSWFCKKHKKNKIKWELDINKESLCEVVKIKNKEVDKKYLNVLHDIRVNGIRSAIDSYKTSIKLKNKGYITTFELKKKNEKSSHICKFTKNSLQFYKEKFYLNRIFCNNNSEIILKPKHYKWILNKYPNGLEYAFSISKDNTGQHYLLIPYIEEKTNIVNENIISLDPGVRTFQTGYDPEGKIIECGHYTINKLKKIFTKISIVDCMLSNNTYDRFDEIEKTKIQKLIKDKKQPKPESKCKSKSRKKKERLGIWKEHNKKNKKNVKYNLIKKRRKYYKKCSNEVLNLHNNLGSFLTKNYKTILLPNFPVSKLIRKIRKESNDSNRVLNTRTAHMMQSLSFYKFKTKLQSLCEKRGNILYIVDESYTSKTCGRCGNLNNKLGGNKIYKCTNCNLVIDRDINGARNILLKHTVLV